MCGIAGKLSFSGGAVSSELLRTMAGQMACRGPDGSGVWVDDGRRLALAHRRLSIIDLDERAAQPMVDRQAHAVISFNGEIYNYGDLRRELGDDQEWRTTSDTEVLLRLYGHHGLARVDACLDRLRGMFAFGLWDLRAKTLILARDPIGKKPLYYATTGDGLVFASSIRALLCDPGVSRTPNDDALDLYLRLGYVPAPLTAFAGIHKLPAGHYLVATTAGIQSIAPFWTLSFEPKLACDRQELKGLIVEGLERATARRMVSDVPLGAFLSGGIDSGAVVATMSRLSSKPVKTFSAGFPGFAGDESASARLVAERFGCQHTALELEIRPDHLPEIVRHFEEPFADAAAIPTYFMSQAARRHVTVALNGDGGDEDFAGYSLRHRAYSIAESLHLPGLLRGAARAAAARLQEWKSEAGLPYRIRKSLSIAGESEWRRNLALMEIYPPRELAMLGGNGTDAARQIAGPIWEAAQRFRGLDRELYFSFALHLPEQLLVKVDRASMAWSLEARSPLLDRDFVELCARIPADAKMHHGRGKQIFREALRDTLPQDILDRPKQGFIPPLADWLRGPLAPLVHETLLANDSYVQRRYSAPLVRRLAAEHMSGARDHQRRLYSLLNLELWERELIRRAP
jgi:asparagine synthase (glutamine-hydrolysing)